MDKYSEEMKGMFEAYKTTNRPTLEILVQLRPTDMVKDLAHCYFAELHRIAGVSGTKLLEAYDVEDVRKYIATLIWMRCCRSVGEYSKMYSPYASMSKNIAVPVLVMGLLIQIGPAYDADYSIRFLPDTTISSNDLLEPDSMRRLSNLFFSLQNNGFKLVAGIPLGQEGELAFMAMIHLQSEVLSYKKSHPVYGFYASFCKQETLNEVTGNMSRILYGYDSDYHAILWQLVSAIGGGA